MTDTTESSREGGFSTRQAAEYIGRVTGRTPSPRTLENWRYRHEGPPYYRIGGAAVYPRHLLDRWLLGQLRLGERSAA